MNEFRLQSSAYQQVKKQTIIRTILITCISAGTGVFFSIYNSTSGGLNGMRIGIFAGIFASVFAWRMYRNLHLLKRNFQQYLLSISGDDVCVQQANGPNISISKIEIKSITKHMGGAISIFGLTAKDFIIVPKQIEQPGQVEQLLTQLHPVTIETSKPLKTRWALPVAIGVAACMIAVYTSLNKLLVGIAGTIVVVSILYLVIQTLRGMYPQVQKRSVIWVMVLLISIIYTMFTKLTAPEFY